MRSHRAPAVLLVAFAAASCGGSDGGTPPPDNQAPTAEFAAPTCTGLACDFTDGSTDPDGNQTIASWAWDFGGDGTSTEQTPSHTFSAAGAYDVTLTVTDDAGATDNVTHTVTVSESGGGNQAPAAGFTVACGSLDCTFTDSSTDPDGNTDITGWAWDFGDNATSTAQNPSHIYTATVPDTFAVRLIVSDAAGAKDTVTHNVTVAPPAACEGASCDITLDQAAKVTVTLTSEDCNANGNTLRITAPVDTTLFTDGCHTAPGTSFELDNAGGTFAAGTQIKPEVISGSQALAFPPTLRLQAGSAYPTWVLEFDDGEGCDAGNPSCGEPDFNDLIITITAHQ